MAACQNQSPSPGSCVALGHRVPSQPTLEVLPETEVNICATEGVVRTGLWAPSVSFCESLGGKKEGQRFTPCTTQPSRRCVSVEGFLPFLCALEVCACPVTLSVRPVTSHCPG
ncbi:hypothetical protein VULLAG_LOCUS20242 [Vulpes lagopus]